MALNCKPILSKSFHSFITFKSCPHLDAKHSVFGKVLSASIPILDQLEEIQTDTQTDRPKEDITIEDTVVLDNPFRVAAANLLIKEWQSKSTQEKAKDQIKWGAFASKQTVQSKADSALSAIGKYFKK